MTLNAMALFPITLSYPKVQNYPRNLTERERERDQFPPSTVSALAELLKQDAALREVFGESEDGERSEGEEGKRNTFRDMGAIQARSTSSLKAVYGRLLEGRPSEGHSGLVQPAGVVK